MAMLLTGITPASMVARAAGAAPVEFSDHVGAPLQEALLLMHNTLVDANRRVSPNQSSWRTRYCLTCRRANCWMQASWTDCRRCTACTGRWRKLNRFINSSGLSCRRRRSENPPVRSIFRRFFG